jgi:threonine aldolase
MSPAGSYEVLADFRSDTVTKPDSEMRRAMMHAEVADNVLDTDPTLAALERRVASLLDMPAALWMPSGSMANLVALMVHLRRGDRFLAPNDVHVLADELGTAAWLAGGMPVPLPHDGGAGRPAPATVRAACPQHATGFTELNTTLLCLENTHNAAGGVVIAPGDQAELVTTARERGLRVHLDGARLWHASVALGVPLPSLTTGVDSVQVCLSKGLGAPVGSVLAADEGFISQARRVRQMLGGGVRQGGVLAAAGLVALTRIDELAADHEKAKALASGLAELGWPVNRPETNIVLATVADVQQALSTLRDIGVLASEIAGRVRFVAHRDISRSTVDAVLDRISSAGGALEALGLERKGAVSGVQ